MLQMFADMESFTYSHGHLAMPSGGHNRLVKTNTQSLVVEVSSPKLAREKKEGKLLKNYEQYQRKSEQQATRINSFEHQNQNLCQLLDNKISVQVMRQAVTSILKINQASKNLGQLSDGSGHTGKMYLGKPNPSKLVPGADSSLNSELECQYCKEIGHLENDYIKLNCRLVWEH